MEKTIAVIRGDGIGPEIVNEAIKVLNKIAAKYGHTFRYVEVDMGGAALEKRAFSPCGRAWACMPTTAPQSFGPNWPPPAP